LISLGADPGALSAVRLTRLANCYRGDRRQELLLLEPLAYWRVYLGRRRGAVNFDPEKFNSAVPAPPTPGGSIDEHATEAQLAALVKVQLPQLRTVGSDWYVYEKGLWKRGCRNIYRPIAINVQNVRSRTERTAANLLSHIESEAQVDEDSFASFHKFDGDAVLLNCASCVLRVTGSAVEQLEHDPKYLFTGQLAARYQENAKAPTFGRVLQESLPDPEDLQLLLLFAGYILLPDCRSGLQMSQIQLKAQ
jgi:D5-like protein